MIWNYIYEFYVRYIFGGYYDGYFYEAYISFYDTEAEEFQPIATYEIK